MKKVTVTVEYNNVLLVVSGVYSPPEKEVTYYADGSGYPGAPSEFDIKTILVQQTDISELLSHEQIQEIEEMVIREIEGQL